MWIMWSTITHEQSKMTPIMLIQLLLNTELFKRIVQDFRKFTNQLSWRYLDMKIDTTYWPIISIKPGIEARSQLTQHRWKQSKTKGSHCLQPLVGKKQLYFSLCTCSTKQDRTRLLLGFMSWEYFGAVKLNSNSKALSSTEGH